MISCEERFMSVVRTIYKTKKYVAVAVSQVGRTLGIAHRGGKSKMPRWTPSGVQNKGCSPGRRRAKKCQLLPPRSFATWTLKLPGALKPLRKYLHKQSVEVSPVYQSVCHQTSHFVSGLGRQARHDHGFVVGSHDFGC